MTASDVTIVGALDPGSPRLKQLSGGPLGTAATDAAASARAAAAGRLGRWLAPAAVEPLAAYLAESAVHDALADADGAVPRFELGEFLDQLCRTPRAVHAAGVGSAAQVELRTTDGPNDGVAYGSQPEPESARILFSPGRLLRALEDGLSLGVRQFDRQFPAWAPIVDDVAAVAGADVFTKLFLAGGDESVTEWHRDQSDVVVTMLAGAKRFDVAPVTARDEPEPEIEVGTELRPGRALLLPRSRAHCATPLGALSALLSIGVMRHADWVFRGAIPTHLGFTTFPPSAAIYRLMLPAHVPAALAPGAPDVGRVWRSRLPGGLAVLDESGDTAEVACRGGSFRCSENALRTLLAVHASGERTEAQASSAAGLDPAAAFAMLRELATAELVVAC